MNNLQTLENEIRSKLQHLMELSAGCEVEFFTKRTKVYIIRDEFYVMFESDCTFYKISSLKGKYKKAFKIIGHEISLANVLEWLNGLDKNIMYAIESDGCLLISRDCPYTAFTFLDKHNNSQIVFWNLSKNLLREQSQELIDGLFNLIEK